MWHLSLLAWKIVDGKPSWLSSTKDLCYAKGSVFFRLGHTGPGQNLKGPFKSHHTLTSPWSLVKLWNGHLSLRQAVWKILLAYTVNPITASCRWSNCFVELYKESPKVRIHLLIMNPLSKSGLKLNCHTSLIQQFPFVFQIDQKDIFCLILVSGKWICCRKFIV